MAPDTTKSEPRVGHHRDGHYQRKNTAGDADDALRERPGSCTHSVLTMDTDAASGSRRRDPEGAHVPRMQKFGGRAQQRRTVHGCQEGQGFASLEVVRASRD